MSYWLTVMIRMYIVDCCPAEFRGEFFSLWFSLVDWLKCQISVTLMILILSIVVMPTAEFNILISSYEIFFYSLDLPTQRNTEFLEFLRCDGDECKMR